jgi:hypothetical protein
VAFEGYLELAGVEIVNTSRAATYAVNLGLPTVECDSCSTVWKAGGSLPVGGYNLPDLDNAPWYDPAVPESARFCGLVGLELAGASKGTATRVPTALAGDGSSPGRLRRAHRELTVRAYALAADQAALSYGLAWLAHALLGTSVCGGSSCSGDAATLYAACPDCTNTLVTCGAYERRTLFNVGLLEGPARLGLDRFHQGCTGEPDGGVGAEVDFTLVAGKPWFYREPVQVASGLTFSIPTNWPCVTWTPSPPAPAGSCPTIDCSTATDTCLQWTPLASCDTTTCSGSEGTCLADPWCSAPTSPPTAPQPVDPCVCLVTLNPAAALASVEAGSLPRWLEKVPIISVTAGSTDLRRLLVRFYSVGDGDLCLFQGLDLCNLRGEIGIPFLPAGSTLLLDGRSQTASVVCADGRSTEPVVYGGTGLSWTGWPVLDCADQWCVAATADSAHVATNATVTISIAAREDAL